MLFGLTLEGAFPGVGEANVLNNIINSKVLTAATLWGKIAAAVTDGPFWGAVINMLFWNFSFWQGPLAMVKWLFFAVSAGFVIAIVFIARGVGSGA